MAWPAVSAAAPDGAAGLHTIIFLNERTRPMMSGMASLMANDSGSASEQQHMTLIVGMLIGQVIALLAGVPGGLAFFWSAQRTMMIIAFAALLIVGAGIQVWAFMSFFAKTT